MPIHRSDENVLIRSPSEGFASRIEQLLDTTGDGTGTTEMAAASAVYKITPPVGKEYNLMRMNIYVQDDAKFRGERYGGSASLVNGIDITIQDGSGSLFRFNPQPIQVIGHWHLLSGVDMYYTDFATGNDIVAVRWSFFKGSGDVSLNGDSGQFLQVETRDSLADLVSHIVQVEGNQRSV